MRIVYQRQGEPVKAHLFMCNQCKAVLEALPEDVRRDGAYVLITCPACDADSAHSIDQDLPHGWNALIEGDR